MLTQPIVTTINTVKIHLGIGTGFPARIEKQSKRNRGTKHSKKVILSSKQATGLQNENKQRIQREITDFLSFVPGNRGVNSTQESTTSVGSAGAVSTNSQNDVKADIQEDNELVIDNEIEISSNQKNFYRIPEAQLRSGRRSEASLAVTNFARKQYNFKFKENLGQGSFGHVKAAEALDTTSLTTHECAVKIVNKSQIDSDPIKHELMKSELQIVKEIDHPKIMKYIGQCEDHENYYMLTEQIQGGEVFDRIEKRGPFSEMHAKIIIKQLMEAVEYLHRVNICHRDLKLENLMFEAPRSLKIKLIDFGFAAKFQPGEKSFSRSLGSPLYLSPELINHQRYSEKVDVWAIGAIACRLLTGGYMFDAPTPSQVLTNTLSQPVTFDSIRWKGISRPAQQFVLACLTKNQDKRPSVEELMADKWLHQS